MQILRKHVLAVGIAAVALAGAGVALATALGGHGSAASHTHLTLRTYRSCPRRDRRPVSSTTVGARTTLVPAGPQHVLLCRYSGVGAYPKPVGPGSFRLIAHHLVAAGTTVARLASELNALKAVTGAQACPNDNGAAIIAFFRYGSAATSDDPGRDPPGRLLDRHQRTSEPGGGIHARAPARGARQADPPAL